MKIKEENLFSSPRSKKINLLFSPCLRLGSMISFINVNALYPYGSGSIKFPRNFVQSPRGVMDSVQAFGAYGEGSIPSGGTTNEKIKNRVYIYGNEGEEENKVLFACQKSKIVSSDFFIFSVSFLTPSSNYSRNVHLVRSNRKRSCNP